MNILGNKSNDFGDNDIKEDFIFNKINKSVIISITQRNSRKSITKIEGLSTSLDMKKIIKELQQKVQSSGSISEVEGHGKVILFQGDKRNEIIKYLVDNNYVNRDNIKLMGY